MVQTIPSATNWFLNPSSEVSALTSIGTLTTSRDDGKSWAGSYATKDTITASQSDGPGSYFTTGTGLGMAGPHDVVTRCRLWIQTGGVVSRVYTELRYTDGSTATTTDVIVTGVGDWVAVTAPSITSATGKTLNEVRMYVRQANPSLAVTVWIDGGECRIDEDIDTYVDGDQGAGYTWIGPAHNSRSVRALAQVFNEALGSGGPLLIETRVERRNKANQFLEDVTEVVIAGEVDWDQDRDVKGTFRATTAHPDRFSEFKDYIAPFMILTRDGIRTEYQMGLYRVMPPEKTITPRGVIGQMECYDLTHYLAMRTCGDTYTAKKGTNPAVLIRSILDDLSLRHSIPTTSRTLSKTRDWPPLTSWYQIVNDLAASMSCYNLWADRTGYLVTIPYLDFDTMTPDAYYRTEDGSPAVIEPYTARPDLTTLANVIRVMKDDPKDPIVVTVVNDNPKSKTSTVELGIIERTVTDSQLEDLAAVNELARRLKQEWGSVLVNGSLTTLLEPWHDGHEMYFLDLTDAMDNEIEEASGRFWCSGWRIGFSKQDARMTHNIWRSVIFGDEV